MNSVVLRQINAVSHIGEPWYVILDFDFWKKLLLPNQILYTLITSSEVGE